MNLADLCAGMLPSFLAIFPSTEILCVEPDTEKLHHQPEVNVRVVESGLFFTLV